jgi:long-chain acyl-CoA synthetase
LLRLIDDFKEYKPTIFVAVPQLLKAFHNVIINKISSVKGGMAYLNVGKTITTISGQFAPSAAPVIFKSIHEAFGGKLKKILLGAAAVEPEIFKDFEKFGFKVYIGYGLTETSPVCVMHTDEARKADTVGYVVPGDKVKIVNPDKNGVGELAVKGPNVMLGYYKDEQSTKNVFDEQGYFLTGDLFCIDEQSGHYKIVGRLKNMIVTPNGKKIFPEEIEVLLSECEGVKECMAYGYDDEAGDTVVAVKIFPDFDRLKIKGLSDNETELQEYFLEVIKNKVNKIGNMQGAV